MSRTAERACDVFLLSMVAATAFLIVGFIGYILRIDDAFNILLLPAALCAAIGNAALFVGIVASMWR